MRKYAIQEAPPDEVEQNLLAYPPLMRQLLFNRGIKDADAARAFLNPSYDLHTHDPFLMKDMEKAVERILRAIQNNERVAIFSDYDADGIPGAVALHDFFKKLGYTNFENYIPDRHDEGFGLNHGAIEQLQNSGTKLLITIDCGITDTLEVARANELGVDVIITDHHLPLRSLSPLIKGVPPSPPRLPIGGQAARGGVPSLRGGVVGAEAGVVSPLRKETQNNSPASECSAPFAKVETTLPESKFGAPFSKEDLRENLPPAYAILNPKQSGCAYPEKMLCGSGVIFKLIQAICSRIRDSVLMVNGQRLIFPVGQEKWFLDLVGLATLSDMVPLTGENRILAYFGLRVLRKSPRKGLLELLSALRLNRKELNEDDIGFSITPRINAASRMGAPMDAFRLLATEDDSEAVILTAHLDKINNERKGKVASLVKEVRKTMEERGARKVVVAGNPNWRPALLGLVANSIAEDLRCPVFLWGRDLPAGAPAYAEASAGRLAQAGESRELKGSCRSGGSVDLSLLMREASSVFLDFGGHKEAGGFSTTLEKVHLLEAEIERAYEKVRESRGQDILPIANASLSLDDITAKTYADIARLAPFGVGNPKPIFLFENVTVRRIEQFGKEKQHLKLVFAKSNGVYVSAIHFYAKPSDFTGEVNEGKPVNLLAHIEQSTFGNRIELRLRIVDMR